MRNSMRRPLFLGIASAAIAAAVFGSPSVCSAQPPAVDRREPLPEPRGVTAERELRLILEKPVRLEFIETPLNEIVGFLAEEYDTRIKLDRRGLEDEAIDTAKLFSMDVEGVSLGAALGQMFESELLTCVVHNETLWITTLDAAQKRMVSRVYRVGDFADGAASAEAKAERLEQLRDALTRTVSPKTWSNSERPAAAAVFEDSLLVHQSLAVHEEIHAFLSALRASRKAVAP